MTADKIEVREVSTFAEFDTCISLQREAFDLPELEVSPRRHFIVTANCGGWTLGAFTGDRMIGFVHHLIALRGTSEIIGYSHMMAVARDFQNKGVGALLKWAQRKRALAEGRSFIRWTWDPMQARNAYFNLNRLGAVVRKYAINFYGTDYAGAEESKDASAPGIDSDRLIAEWELDSPSVEKIAAGESIDFGTPLAEVVVPANWAGLLIADRSAAARELARVRGEFKDSLSSGLVCRSFYRDEERPRYLFFGN